MASYDSDQVMMNGDTEPANSIAKSLLVSLSEITASAENAEIEKNDFHEIGSYFHRVSSAIKELAENHPDSLIEILQSLSERAELAKPILGKLQQRGERINYHEAETMINQLEEIINHMGEDLGSLPASAFRDENYADTVVLSLSEEMRKVHFKNYQVPESKSYNQQLYTLYKEEHLEEEHIAAYSDPCSISTVGCTENSHVSDIPHLLEALETKRQGRQRRQINMNDRLPGSVTGTAQYVEPLYQSFCCPLTNQIMDDPVTIQSGVTYERKAIREYFENFQNSEDIVCPTSKEKLESRGMSPNIALRNIIREWKDRNETAQLKVIRAAFSIGSTDDMILEALKDLQNICQRSPKKIIEVCNIGIIPLLVRLLELKERNVRLAVLEMTRLLAEEDKIKELIAETPAIASTTRMLSSSYQPIRHAVLLLLIELSRSKPLSEKIGYVKGGILLLVQTKYNRSSDPFASEAADQVLKNMEQCPNNVKFMAENGYLEPLINNLIEGSEERKLQMVTYLGEIILEDDSKTYVAEKASPVLIQMLQNGDKATRKTVYKALGQFSSYPSNGRILVEAGTVQIMVEEMAAKNMLSKPTNSLKEASVVLANILASGVGLENLIVNSEGHTLVSGYVVHNIIYMIKNSVPDDLNLNLLRIVYYIAKQSAAPVVSAVKESEASYTLVELLNNPRDEIAIAAIKLLTLLAPTIGHLLIDRLCKTKGQPEGLVLSLSDPSQVTERQALSVCFLARLPHQNITLNRALLGKNTIPIVLESVSLIENGSRQNRYSHMCLEGLVGILVRLTATLYDHEMLFMAMNYDFAAVLVDLLAERSNDEVQRLAATGLEKLSAQSIHLSKPPQRTRTKFLDLLCLPQILVCGSSRKTEAKLCITHKGVCSEKNTFCLIEAGAIERLLQYLEHRNADVAEAALSALATLLDDKVDLEQSVNMLTEMNATQQILKAVKCHKNESLWQKAFWMLERFLMKGNQRSLCLISQDRLFSVSVVTAFHHGDAYMRQMAEKILRHLDKMPSFSGTFTM